MQYIHIPNDFSTRGFYILMCEGTKEGCIQVLQNDNYIVNKSHIRILKKEGIPFEVVKKEQISAQHSA